MTTGDPPPTVRDMATGEVNCGRPPAGWYCTREPGHEGPCAASPDPRVSEKATYIKCESYTTYTPRFGLYVEQEEAIHKWMKEHDEARHIKPGQKHRYSGAIGGAYTFEFTGTSLGTCVHVRCSCGEEIDVTDYDNW